jgi:hypothetical protein
MGAIVAIIGLELAPVATDMAGLDRQADRSAENTLCHGCDSFHVYTRRNDPRLDSAAGIPGGDSDS